MTGLIVAIVPKKEDHDCLYPTLTIADCSEKINLDFSYYEKREKNAAKTKLELFRSEINAFVDAALAEMDAPVIPKKPRKPKKATTSSAVLTTTND